MKSFKEVINEGGEMYPADDMTMKEVKIACYAAQNILERLENGAMLQRWQISAIVKAKEELASVYTSMSADEEGDDEWEDDDYGDEEEQVYVGYEYPGMYEAVDKNHPIVKEYDSLKKHDIDTLRGMAKKHSRVVDASGLKTKDHAITHILRAKHGNKKVDQAFGLKEEVDLDENYGTAVKKAEAARQRALKKAANMVKNGFSHEAAAKNHDVKVDDLKRHMNEEADFKVSVEGLPKMFVKAKSESDAKSKLRKVVKNPDMIKDVERVNASDVKKSFRDFLSGKKEIEENLEESPAEMKKAALDVKKVYNGGGKPPHYVVVRGVTGLKAFDNEADARAHRDHLKRQEEMKEDLSEVSTEKLRDYASAALQDKNKAKADKRWKYAGKAMDKVADREVKAAHALKYNKTEETNIDENYIVHVDDGSRYGDTPHKKDVEHVMAGAKMHGGEFDGVSDKGAFYKFKNRSSASNFVNHVRKSPHKTVDATLDESANLDEAESWEAGYKRRVVKTTKPEHKEKGYNWRIKGKERPEISIKLYKEKPSQEEFNKQMKRVAGHEFGG